MDTSVCNMVINRLVAEGYQEVNASGDEFVINNFRRKDDGEIEKAFIKKLNDTYIISVYMDTYYIHMNISKNHQIKAQDTTTTGNIRYRWEKYGDLWDEQVMDHIEELTEKLKLTKK